MKNLTITYLLLTGLIASCTNPNELELKSLSNEVIFTKVDNQPTFAGGMPAFFEYVQSNLVYPTDPKLAGVQGKVFIQFIVTKDGSIEEAIVLKGLEETFDKAALEVVNNSPAWNPGSQKGVPVNVRLVLPIAFGKETKTEELLPANFSLDKKVDKMPEYKGGLKAFYNYVLINIKYPKEARENNVYGNVIIEFTVSKDGTIKEASVIGGIGSGCDEAALKIIRNSTGWIPGQFKNKPVDVQLVLPISFRLKD